LTETTGLEESSPWAEYGSGTARKMMWRGAMDLEAAHLGT
jgi:hypothetical protein